MPHALLTSFTDPSGRLRFVGLYTFSDDRGHLAFTIACAKADRNAYLHLVAAEEAWSPAWLAAQLGVRDSSLALVTSCAALRAALDMCTSFHCGMVCAHDRTAGFGLDALVFRLASNH